MFVQRTASALARRAPIRAFAKARPFTSSITRCTFLTRYPGYGSFRGIN